MSTKRTITPWTDLPDVGPRQPCPCGSGKRYKACHGKRRRGADQEFVARPFEGLPAETDWIALREIVSSATAPVRLAPPHADRSVLVATLLPMAAPAFVRADGQILLALQTSTRTADPSADTARALLAALDAEPGTPVTAGLPEPDESRLQDVLDPSGPFPVTVHGTFDFWLDPSDSPDADDRATVERANAELSPAARLASVDACYWCRIGDRDQLRWVMPYDEEPLLDALARLHARGEDGVGSGTRLLGTFRALGRLVPVWDLVPGTSAAEVEEPAAALASRLAAAVAVPDPLSADERRARSGLTNRQVTIRFG
ncbi:MAG TPA: DUF5926 family protein [Jiangellaceae bacterium]|nr:DUF5926 family protein [Jiangellaceae bacterium]